MKSFGVHFSTCGLIRVAFAFGQLIILADEINECQRQISASCRGDFTLKMKPGLC